jgi:putative SOS response-associated peptidase YedK
MFADAFRRRRAIVPADVYYQRGTVPGAGARYAISRVDGKPMAWGGLWESYQPPGGGQIIRTFSVVTMPANMELAKIHDRMPLVLEEADWAVWLGEAPGDAAALLRPASEGVLKVRPMGGTPSYRRG